MSSDQLAHEMLEAAREKAKSVRSGESVTVEVPGRHLDVHHLELSVSFMALAGNYGLVFEAQFDNQASFMKP